MKLKPTDSGRKVTCKIDVTQIEDAELYYCPEGEYYYILQNKSGGAKPQNLSPKDKGYECSWCYCSPSKDWICPYTTEFKFKDNPSVNDFRANSDKTLGTITTVSIKQSSLVGYVNTDIVRNNNEEFLLELEAIMIKHKIQKIDVCWRKEF